MFHQTYIDQITNLRLFHSRLRVMALAMICMFLLLIVRLGFLQIAHNQTYTTLSQKNSLALIPSPPERGRIYDRHGELLADNIPVYHLEITPQWAKKFEKSIARLKTIVDIDEQAIEDFIKLKNQRRPFEPIPLLYNLNSDEMAKISVHLHQMPGFRIAARLQRRYLKGAAFGHIMGYLGPLSTEELQIIDKGNYAATNIIGKSGIEKVYEDALHGQVGFQQIEIDAHAHVIRTTQDNDPLAGQDIKLSIDAGLQAVAFEALKDLKGALIAIDTQNGEILSMISSPSFDPDAFVNPEKKSLRQEYLLSKNRPLFNRCINGLYPMASTIKPFLALQGLEKQIVTPSYQIEDPGWFKLPNASHVFRDWKYHGGGHGWVNLKRSIRVSCDTYYYNLAHLMGINNIKAILTQFGFGKKTQVDLPREYMGVIPDPAWKKKNKQAPWYGGDTLLTGIGQGFVNITPMQLAHATQLLANRGHGHKPHLLQAVGNPHHWQTISPTPAAVVPIQERKHWETVIDAMAQSINMREGTAWRFGRDNPHKAAAKTGTGQVFNLRSHAQLDPKNLPEHLRDHSLFIAFAPSKNPTIAVACVVEHNPTAQVVVRKVLDQYFNQAKVV